MQVEHDGALPSHCPFGQHGYDHFSLALLTLDFLLLHGMHAEETARRFDDFVSDAASVPSDARASSLGRKSRGGMLRVVCGEEGLVFQHEKSLVITTGARSDMQSQGQEMNESVSERNDRNAGWRKSKRKTGPLPIKSMDCVKCDPLRNSPQDAALSSPGAPSTVL